MSAVVVLGIISSIPCYMIGWDERALLLC